ncbi:MAG: hypothetical protein LBK67_06960 [Coriobacteriales bacterium]|jgi:hypothetical protein|nr:hypothetical protein [Coriobacteriales bacterium]
MGLFILPHAGQTFIDISAGLKHMENSLVGCQVFCHCNERSDETIHARTRIRSRLWIAALASLARNDGQEQV